MARSTERAINMALRVLGIGEAERDLRKVGTAGEQGFEKVGKAANGANREISEYTARLKRVTAAAKQAFDAHPDVQVARRLEPGGYQAAKNKFVLDAIEAEKKLIQQGLPESTAIWEAAAGGAESYALSLGAVTAGATAAGAVLVALGKLTLDGLQAWQEHEQELAAFEARLRLVGNQSEATAGQIEAMADRVVDATLQTRDSALSAAQELSTIPGMTTEGLEAALDASSRLADALQTDVASVVSDITAPAIRALVDGDLEDFYKTTKGKLSPALQKLVLDLAEAGKTADAQRALVQGLAEAAGDGPNGLSKATNRASDAWDRFKRSIGGFFAEPAARGLDFLSDRLDALRGNMEDTGATWARILPTLVSNPIQGVGQLGSLLWRTPDKKEQGSAGRALNRLSSANQAAAAREQAAAARALEQRYGGDTPNRGRSGKSSAEREAEARKREAEQARASADRVSEANDKVIASYDQRAREAEAKIGLEGAALKAVERAQRVEAAVRRISTEEIEKQVEARRKEAAAAGKQFDEAQATRDARAAVAEKADAVRDLAERYEDANEALAEFNEGQRLAARILDELKTPIDHINDAVDEAIVALRRHRITVDQFDQRMKQLAYDMADARLEMDHSRQAWIGFGQDVGRSLSDVVLYGGSARDVLQQLIRLPLERLLQQTVENPIANFIDTKLNLNRDRNAAAELVNLPRGSQVAGANVQLLDASAGNAAASVTNLASAANGASAAFGGAPLALSSPMDALAAKSDAAGQALGELIPLTGQFGGALGQLIAMLAATAGGGAGGVGGLISAAGSLIGGGSGLDASVAQTIAANPAIFASGTDRVPVGKPFWVGDNGRELMQFDGAGNLSVTSNQKARRFLSESGGGAPTIVQHITIPPRADPRRTAAGIARSTQGALSRSNRKGLASPGDDW
ncbi:phage tail length tape measure family protein [Novosphingobium mangrovi (ex Huang et al. 2023)]|uniref:Phage tail length tape measure family protein n=1 Tax=Novosphingobium mangrovi (ex Huang et al. 2023) TaxID=2976432 RepID=A0ABT2I154_9SPHN|nr:phage tail length tape measure family protein [Novosphingobium mangrovi (ex Huang et al. 2023)]MCT2398531.1 phage tail length tape measure family protein [Novosphingobium mangrovi (ex Huang et al. 2023)]